MPDRDRSMNVIHLSDLHLRLDDAASEAAQESLMDCLQRNGPWDADLIAVTGDVLDSADMPEDAAVDLVTAWCQRLWRALGREVPLILVPGNHDRRTNGMLSPQSDRLFAALKVALRGRPVWVGGCAQPLLAEVLPDDFAGVLPCQLCIYDSTFLGRGLFSAGGTMRAEDLLQMADLLRRQRRPDDDRPVLLLMHHHLVPTAVTDTERVKEGDASVLINTLRSTLAHVVAHGESEELFMTAFGAGTALSLLHKLGYPVVILHGHKHHPTARLLAAPDRACGDLLLVAAGSAGGAECWQAPGDNESVPMKMWPSLNYLQFRGGTVQVQVVAYSPRLGHGGDGVDRRAARHGLLRARVQKGHFRLLGVPARGFDGRGPVWAANRAAFRLSQAAGQRDRWDVYCEREATVNRRGAGPHDVREGVACLPHSRLEWQVGGADRTLMLPGRAVYVLKKGMCRTLGEARRVVSADAAFGHVELLNRYHSYVAELSLVCDEAVDAFASATDLTNGQSRPLPLQREGDRFVLRYAKCPARTLLRIHFPLVSTES